MICYNGSLSNLHVCARDSFDQSGQADRCSLNLAQQGCPFLPTRLFVCWVDLNPDSDSWFLIKLIQPGRLPFFDDIASRTRLISHYIRSNNTALSHALAMPRTEPGRSSSDPCVNIRGSWVDEGIHRLWHSMPSPISTATVTTRVPETHSIWMALHKCSKEPHNAPTYHIAGVHTP